MTTATEITADSAVMMYLKNYVDLTDNFPNDMARLISEIHLVDVKRSRCTRLLEIYKNKYLALDEQSSDIEREKILGKIENTLLFLERETDMKLSVVRSMLEQIDLKSRQLDASYRLANSLNPANQSSGQTNGAGCSTSTYTAGSKNSAGNSSSSSNYNTSRHETSANGRHSPAFAKDRDNNNGSSATNGKRMRRGSNKQHGESNNNGSGDDRATTPVANERNTGMNSTGARRGGGGGKRGLKSGGNGNGGHNGGGKSEKRGKSSYGHHNNSHNNQMNDDVYDPNEPTYCLCEQVSYGEMICCDNSECSIEWFHFACVSLTTKPKGRWFCPNCRGERSNIQKK